MPLNAIDWSNIAATLASACMGGLIAARIAGRQIQAAQLAERDKSRRENARDLIEAIDSYLHIAYRDHSQEGPLERQRLRRRILSLLVLCLPAQFEATQRHLDTIDQWWRARRSGTATRVTGVGYTATENFFYTLKSALFEQVFGIHVELTRASDAEPEPQP